MPLPATRADIEPEAIDDLITVRDWLRYATSRFNANRLVYGHGTARALDEAAFLILSALDLPVDELDPWLDARLSRSERMRIADLLQRRITTRKPAAYLTRSAWIQGHRFYVDERVIVPRSFIGELIAGDGLGSIVPDGGAVRRVLELCTGSGCLAVLAALAFPEAEIDAVDISGDALPVAARNVADYGLQHRIRLLQGDLYAPVGDARYDLVIANPPYVTRAAVAAFPPEYRAEPEIAHLGGVDGMDIVRRILDEGARHLEPEGALVVEIGMGRPVIEAAYPALPFLWLDTAESEGEVLALTADAFAPREPAVARRAPRKTKRTAAP